MKDDDDFKIVSSLISPKTGIVHTNRLRFRKMPGYLQIWAKSGIFAEARIRLEADQVDDLINFLTKYREELK